VRFELPSDAGSFEIPDDWWRFAEMERFRPSPGGYYPYQVRGENDVDLVPIAHVEPPRRNPGVAMLKKFKMMPVLFAFQSPECALPAVEVYPATSSIYRFTVHNGFHRFYGSVAAGYNYLPVLVCEPLDF
jgi:hypothetical protein